MPFDDEAQAYLDESIAKRGYVLKTHELLAGHDLPTLKALDHVVDATYLDDRLLDRKTKELLFVVSQAALRLPKAVIGNHIKLALDYGATPEEILEAIEILLPEAGIPTFAHGVDAWAEVVGAERPRTSVPVYEGGRAQS